jgi:hypothetical protein
MNIEMMRDFFLWFVAISYAILFLWFLVFMFARNPIYNFLKRALHMSEETFNAIHYGGMMTFLVGIILLALVPFISLCVINGAP